MAVVKISMAQWPAYLRKLGERSRAAAMRGVVSGAQRCIPILQQRTEKAPPASPKGSVGAFNTGNYRGRWRVRTLENGAAVFNDASYAGIIDEGRRPFKDMPPLRVIQRWAQRRLGLSEKEAKKAAFPIAAAIQARGLDARRVLSGATDELKKVVIEEIERELKAELNR